MKYILYVFLFFLTPVLHAKEGLSLFMDAEIHDWLQTMSEPLLKAADISETQVEVYVAKNSDLNAFATASGAIVLYSGLILEADTEDEVRAVLAHEIAHIKAKHHLKSSIKNSKEKFPTILGAILGVGAAAAGAPDAAQGLILGGVGASQSNILKHSRTHEWEADKIAMEILKKSKANPEGFASFFEKLRQQQVFYSKTPPAYLLTHPVSNARMDAARAAVEKLESIPPKADDTLFFRIQSKLKALSTDPKKMQRVLGYEENDNAVYSRSIALALEGKTLQALSELDKIEGWKEDPFYNEFTGLLYQDLGKLEDAQAYFEKAHMLKPDNPLLASTLASNLISLDRNKDAIVILRKLLITESKWPFVYHQLGVAYGKEGEIAYSHIFLAQKELLRNKMAEAQRHINIAENAIQEETDEHIKQQLRYVKSILDIEEKK